MSIGNTNKLSRLDEPLGRLSHPVSRAAAADQLNDVTVRLANGEANLGELVGSVSSDDFESAGDLRDELYEYLPEAALGEPAQSEGDA